MIALPTTLMLAWSFAAAPTPTPAPVAPAPAPAVVPDAPAPSSSVASATAATPAPAPAPTAVAAPISVEPKLAPTLEIEPRLPPLEPRSGRGLMWAGGATVLAGASMRAGLLWGTQTKLQDNCPEDLDGLSCSIGAGISHVMVEGARISSILISTGHITAGGMAMLAVGAARRGRWLAYNDARDGRSRRTRIGLGWGLAGAGLSLWAATRLAAYSTDDPITAVVTEEVGWYASVPLTSVGLALALQGMRYRKGRKEFDSAFASNLQVSLAPMSGGGALSISGRF